MKTFIALAFLVSFSAFAASEELTQALVDNAEKMVELKNECATGVRSVSTTKVKEGVWLHKVELGRKGRGDSKPDCEVSISQDFTPTYHDAGIAYKISVKQLK